MGPRRHARTRRSFTPSRRRALRRWTASRAFSVIAGTLFYGLPDLGTGRNPNWDAMDSGADRAATGRSRATFDVRRPTGEAQDLIEADVVVIGSGAGGGVIAGRACGDRQVGDRPRGGRLPRRRGLRRARTLRLPAHVLERGPLPHGRPPRLDRRPARRRGGTVINWTNCLRHRRTTSGPSRQSRARPVRPGRVEPRRAPRRCFKRIKVNGDCSDLWGRTCAFRRRARSSATTSALITRNPTREVRRGVSGIHGLRRRVRLQAVDRRRRSSWTRRSARRRSWSAEGAARPGRGGEGGWRRGALVGATRAAERHEPTKLTVRAPVVVAACGSIESPTVLGAGHRRPGGRRLPPPAPTVAVTAYYDEPQNWMSGPPQAALDEFADLGDGYGYLIESAQADDRPLWRGGTVALGPTTAPHAPVGARGAVDRARCASAATAE